MRHVERGRVCILHSSAWEPGEANKRHMLAQMMNNSTSTFTLPITISTIFPHVNCAVSMPNMLLSALVSVTLLTALGRAQDGSKYFV